MIPQDYLKRLHHKRITQSQNPLISLVQRRSGETNTESPSSSRKSHFNGFPITRFSCLPNMLRNCFHLLQIHTTPRAAAGPLGLRALHRRGTEGPGVPLRRRPRGPNAQSPLYAARSSRPLVAPGLRHERAPNRRS